MLPTATLPALRTLTEVSERTNISLRVLEDGCRARRWQHYHIGSKRFMSDEQIVLLLEQQLVNPPAEVDDLAATRARVSRRVQRQAARGDQRTVAR